MVGDLRGGEEPAQQGFQVREDAFLFGFADEVAEIAAVEEGEEQFAVAAVQVGGAGEAFFQQFEVGTVFGNEAVIVVIIIFFLIRILTG